MADNHIVRIPHGGEIEGPIPLGEQLQISGQALNLLR